MLYIGKELQHLLPMYCQNLIEFIPVKQAHPLLKNKTIGLERKKSKNEKRKEKRDIQREITKKVNECFGEKSSNYITHRRRVETEIPQEKVSTIILLS